jgi:hypothetical protein
MFPIAAGVAIAVLIAWEMLTQFPVSNPDTNNTRAFLATMCGLSASMAGLMNATLFYMIKGRLNVVSVDVLVVKNLDIFLMGAAVLFFLVSLLFGVTSLLRLTPDGVVNAPTLVSYMEPVYWSWKFGLAALLGSLGFKMVHGTFNSLKAVLANK